MQRVDCKRREMWMDRGSATPAKWGMADTTQNPTSKEAIGARLKLVREALELSQAEICRRAGIATNTWNNYEKGKNRISLDEALKVANATGIPLDYIYRGIDAFLPVHVGDGIRRLRSTQETKRETA
ncbi:XRE family transcriptional regulator [Methylobacterium currus]|uniref:XRE family transcriptional regulator n=1 Tax=Methylobacterium currus TaxID=2051553 RepID=A0A2R4WI41_9HYPH|nr:helix-turn-helix transcriptional regulator [Methylobacterium currus]AWB21214.1 XRE family transcriptional regulator [Methylobacterium currus]